MDLTTPLDANGIPTKGSSLVEQIYTILQGCYFPGSGTFGEFWKKQVLMEFIQNSGMPLGYKTIKDSTSLEDRWLNFALDNLAIEGYIEKIDSPASFLFPGQDGDGWQLKMDAEDAEEKAKEKVEAEKASVPDPAAAQMAQPATKAGP